MWKRVFCFRVRVKADGLLGILVNEVSFPWTDVDTHASLVSAERRVIPTDKLHKVQVL